MNKVKIDLEYGMGCTARSLYNALSTPAGLSNWFADNVTFDGNEYTFCWDNVYEKARIEESKENLSIKFVWIEEPDYYINFNIEHQDFTQDILLTVTDFDFQSELEDMVNLWNLQVDKLKRSIGCVKK